MKLTPRLFGLLFGGLAAVGVRAEGLLLRGTVGKYPVVIQLDSDGKTLFGDYFYEKHKQGIPLHGSVEQQTYQLKSGVFDMDGAKTDQFTLSKVDGGFFKGTFTTDKGPVLPVELHAVDPGSVADPRPDLHLHLLESRSAYEKLQLTDLKFIAGKKETVGGKYQIQWYRESLSGISMFHVTGGYSESAMAGINRVIDQDFYASVSHYFGCPSGDGGSGTESLKVSSHYLSERFVSYSIASSWDCAGAAHPDFSTAGTIIDAQSGRELELEDIYGLGTGQKPAPDSDALRDYREKVFAPAVVKLFQRLYPQQMQKDGDEGCDYNDPGVWDVGPWYLTDKGLYAGAYFARVERSCDAPDWSIIPYSVLKKRNPALFGD